MGEKKAAMPAAKIFTLGIISGCHIAMGALLAITVGGNCPGLAATNPGLQKIVFGAFGKRRDVLNLVRLFTCTMYYVQHCEEMNPCDLSYCLAYT